MKEATDVNWHVMISKLFFDKTRDVSIKFRETDSGNTGMFAKALIYHTVRTTYVGTAVQHIMPRTHQYKDTLSCSDSSFFDPFMTADRSGNSLSDLHEFNGEVTS